MEQPITIGVDLAKSVFQLHGIDAEGAVVLRRQVRRSQMLEVFRNLRPCPRRHGSLRRGPLLGPHPRSVRA